jgi:hypothetical protein
MGRQARLPFFYNTTSPFPVDELLAFSARHPFRDSVLVLSLRQGIALRLQPMSK